MCRIICRVYILKGKSLTPADKTNSDPYLILRLGNTEIKDMSSLRPDTNYPWFYK